MKSLSIRNLSKTYFDLYAGTQVTAVHDVSLNVPEGEFVSIVGPSGCGKSTILNMIAGFIPITGGEILVGRQPVKGPGPDRGVVFQSFALFPWRTVLENVAFGPKMRGIPKVEREKIAHDYLVLAKLTEAAGRYPNELSGGMQQRVGVVRALARRHGAREFSDIGRVDRDLEPFRLQRGDGFFHVIEGRVGQAAEVDDISARAHESAGFFQNLGDAHLRCVDDLGEDAHVIARQIRRGAAMAEPCGQIGDLLRPRHRLFGLSEGLRRKTS